MLTPEEGAYHDALVSIAEKYGPFDQGTSSIWVGYESAEQNENASIGVKCSNCSFHYMTGNGMGCKIVSFLVEPEAYCRLAAIPDGLVNPNADSDDDDDDMVDKKAPCWDGYVQQGMKPGEDGRPVPNCVPAKKESFWGGTFDNSFAKRDYSTASRRRMAESGAAMPDGSFPIANETDLRNAIQSVGRASSYEAARRHIIRRARALGLTRLLPEDWK